jgi:glycosyltransferase involved in cell wall biosynthesis
MSEIVFIVPGKLDQLTGGYLYDRHIIEGLRARGRAVGVIELGPGDATVALAALADGTTTVIDGLAFPIVARMIMRHRRRLRLLALVHHPLAEETGLSPAARERAARLEAALLPHFDGVVCPSRGTAAAVERCGTLPERIMIVPPGTTRPMLRRLPRRGPARALLCVASLIPRKGHRVLLEALARLDDLDWELLCVGSLHRDPATTRQVRRMISAAGLKRRVTLAGEQPRQAVTRAYRGADVFVLPSFHEGYGMAYAEAMAHGLPIIATTAGAIPATVPREAGLFVPPGDSAALARALRRVIAEPAVARQLAAGARAAGSRLPDWRQAAKAWDQVLHRLDPSRRDGNDVLEIAGTLGEVEQPQAGMSKAAAAHNPRDGRCCRKP